ncbi:MAG: excinuclease ABC subunit UvrC [Bacteriovoracaceae bacterium]|nr:excinuclease ABC subunit UvrC [Bacteriovoracaceae bacterium]
MANQIEKLLKKAKNLSRGPGCYLMKKSDGQVVYVGKAKNLRSRVVSYFNASVKEPKTEILVKHIHDFDFMVTANETEAFILENNLIKRYRPKYNIRLKDDKSYPYVMVDTSEPYPRLQYVRRAERKDGIVLFGPFVTGSNLSQVIRILSKSFGLRDCSLNEFRSRKNPCILYQMKQCLAPCIGLVDEDEYKKNIDLALDVFKGGGEKSLNVLRKKMFESSENEEFERAAGIRDQINVLEGFLGVSRQKNVELSGKEKDLDVVSCYSGDTEIDISVYMIRNGLLLGNRNYHFSRLFIQDEHESVEEGILSFLFQYYEKFREEIPKTIILSFDKEKLAMFQKALSDEFVEVVVRSPGRKFDSLAKLVKGQAIENQKLRISNSDDLYQGLQKLKELLGLWETPRLLECFDVAIWQGTSPTASQIVFHDGRPDKTLYRHYQLQTRPEGNNDFAMMKELMKRRIKHGDLPDVFVVDGGMGQVNQFLAVLKDEKIEIPVVGIAKARAKSKTEERLIIPGRSNPWPLSKNRGMMNILVRMRNEAHRFSRRLHHKHEKNRVMASWFDDIHGIGKVTRERILKKLDRKIEDLSQMGVVELCDLFDIREELACRILEKLRDQ